MELGRDNRTNRRSRSDANARSPMGETRHWQIGPRIRIGGTLGKIGQEAKIGVGKLASNPIVEGVAGAFLGPEASAALGALGRTLDTSNGGLHGLQGVGDLALSGVKGAAAGYAGSKLGSLASAIKNGGVSGGVQSLEGMLGLGGAGAGQNPDGSPTGGGGGFVQGLEGLLGKAGGFLTGNGGLNALGVAQGVNAALQQKKAEDYAKNALGAVTQSYNERAPLRAQGIQSLQTAMKANPFATGTPQRTPSVQPIAGGY